MADRWDRTLVTVVNESGSARPTLMDWRLHIFCISHSGSTDAGSFWGAVSGSYASSCSGYATLSVGISVVPSMDATASAVCLEGDDELHVHRCKIRRESCNSIHELCDGGAVTSCGHL